MKEEEDEGEGRPLFKHPDSPVNTNLVLVDSIVPWPNL